MKLIFSIIILFGSTVFANPYFDPSRVPQDSAYGVLPKLKVSAPLAARSIVGLEALRISVKVDAKERYSLATLTKEFSGTEAMVRRAAHVSPLGSYRGTLKNAAGKVVAVDSIGTGKEFRKLTDAITFRFPSQRGDLKLEVEAENPTSGKMEKVFEQTFNADQVALSTSPTNVEIRQIGLSSTKTDSLKVNIYAEGYSADKKALFFADAEKTAAALLKNNFPQVSHMSFYAVFAASNLALGTATNLGFPVKERDSFLGLYFPYWDNFGRWYHVLYPTREEKFREALASAPYDYAIVLVDSDDYFGVGNFREHTAIPARNSAFIYLLLHEIGHYFGLNEEYDSSGRTELEFAPQIVEPWSQNITFLRSKDHSSLKWNKFVSPLTPLPTSFSSWEENPAKYGAYRGGYAESEPLGHSHKPGLNCVMDRYQDFCDVCKEAISKVIEFDRAAN